MQWKQGGLSPSPKPIRRKTAAGMSGDHPRHQNIGRRIVRQLRVDDSVSNESLLLSDSVHTPQDSARRHTCGTARHLSRTWQARYHSDEEIRSFSGLINGIEIDTMWSIDMRFTVDRDRHRSAPAKLIGNLRLFLQAFDLRPWQRSACEPIPAQATEPPDGRLRSQLHPPRLGSPLPRPIRHKSDGGPSESRISCREAWRYARLVHGNMSIPLFPCAALSRVSRSIQMVAKSLNPQ